jgi:hypothetical protein
MTIGRADHFVGRTILQSVAPYEDAIARFGCFESGLPQSSLLALTKLSGPSGNATAFQVGDEAVLVSARGPPSVRVSLMLRIGLGWLNEPLNAFDNLHARVNCPHEPVRRQLFVLALPNAAALARGITPELFDN